MIEKMPILVLLLLEFESSQGRLKLWTSDLRAFFLSLHPARISKKVIVSFEEI